MTIEKATMTRTPEIPGYVTEETQALRSGVTLWTIRRWRRQGYGPRWAKFGRFVLYAEDANERFIAEEAAAAETRHNPPRRGRPRSPRPTLAART